MRCKTLNGSTSMKLWRGDCHYFVSFGCARGQIGERSCNLERLTQRLKFFDLPALQLRSDLLKLPYSLYRVEPLATAAADLGLYLEDRLIVSSTKELLDLLFDQLPTTDRATVKRDHFSTSLPAN